MESDAGGGEPVVGGSVEEAPGDVSRKGLTTYGNYLKLLTAFLAQQCFASNRRVMSILLHLDNVTAIPFLNTMGGTHSAQLCSLAVEVWKWCLHR